MVFRKNHEEVGLFDTNWVMQKFLKIGKFPKMLKNRTIFYKHLYNILNF